jgi:membrane-associated phospholipid phosphatase
VRRHDPGVVLARAALALLAVTTLVPFASGLDARLDWALEAWRTCRGLVLAERVSDLVQPVGLAVLALATAFALWRGRPPRQVIGVLVSLAVGTLVIGALKDVFDRPRPGAEFLAPGGGSFPSGHVGNTILNAIAIWVLWTGRGTRPWPRALGWMVIGAVIGVVAAARVYGRRHWPSDVLAAVAIGGAYAALALLHPDARWRVAATVIGLVLSGAGRVAAAAGAKIPFPAGTAAGRAAPVAQLSVGDAQVQGALHGAWARGEPDPLRRTAWLRGPVGTVDLPGTAGPIGEVRVVARPRAECARLRVALNGRPLGERILHQGWRAYTFPARGSDGRSDHNVLELGVATPSGPTGEARRAGFSEVTLHPARSPSP